MSIIGKAVIGAVIIALVGGIGVTAVRHAEKTH